MLKKSLLVSSVTAVLLGGSANAQQAPLQPSPIKRTPLGKVEVPGSNYEVVFSITELAAGFKSGRHSHPGPLLAYVVDGEFWYLVDGQPEKIFKVGESFQLPHGAVHNEGAAGNNPVKVMVVFVVEKGKPLVQPASATQTPPSIQCGPQCIEYGLLIDPQARTSDLHLQSARSPNAAQTVAPQSDTASRDTRAER